MLVSTQFLSSLADNALLIIAVALLLQRHAPAWMTPGLRILFYLCYLLLAPVAGLLADRYRKSRVLFATGLVKMAGCGLLIAHIHPLIAYALVGFGAAAYVPAKYGSLPELLAPDDLVTGNAWIEVTSVLSILLGVALGSWLLSGGGFVADDVPDLRTQIGLHYLAIVYALAAACALLIRSPCPLHDATQLVTAPVRRFMQAQALLWRDLQAAQSLAVTSLFWGVAAVLQFLVLRWSQDRFALSLAQGALLQLPVALGMIGGALVAARWIALNRINALLPVGIAMGVLLILIAATAQIWLAIILLTTVGILGGMLLVPMNALLQNRGQTLLSAGQSIAVQNFSEHLAAVGLLAAYGVMEYLAEPLQASIVGTGAIVIITMGLLAMTAHTGPKSSENPAQTAPHPEPASRTSSRV